MINHPNPIPSILPLTEDREKDLRRAVVQEALKWEGTPYYHQGDTLGAGVDCCMLLVRSWVSAGVVESFDPRPYPTEWNLHRSEERYLNWLSTCAKETDTPQMGDIFLWRFGRCFAHSAIMIDDNTVIHALAAHRICVRTSINESFLKFEGRSNTLRPVKYFDVFAHIRSMT